MAGWVKLIDLLVAEGFAEFIDRENLRRVILHGDVRINWGKPITDPSFEIDPEAVVTIQVGRFSFPGPIPKRN